MNFLPFVLVLLFLKIIILFFAMQLLIFLNICQQTNFALIKSLPFRVVGSNGLGPSTSRLSGVCSNQLSYEPILVEVIGFEPMTPCLQGRCSTS